MKRCAWRKGCEEYAYSPDSYCYAHQKRREPPVKPGDQRDLWTSEALAIKDAETMLTRARSKLSGHRPGKPVDRA